MCWQNACHYDEWSMNGRRACTIREPPGERLNASDQGYHLVSVGLLECMPCRNCPWRQLRSYRKCKLKQLSFSKVLGGRSTLAWWENSCTGWQSTSRFNSERLPFPVWAHGQLFSYQQFLLCAHTYRGIIYRGKCLIVSSSLGNRLISKPCFRDHRRLSFGRFCCFCWTG